MLGKIIKIKERNTMEWKEYKPRKEVGIKIMCCDYCKNHHFHILNIGGKLYAQCGRCNEMKKI